MPNSFVDIYRKYLADTGQQDDSTDYQITEKLGQWAQQNNPGLFQQYPDFGDEFGAIREANAPSLLAEGGRALKAGTQELGATGLGALALATGSDTLKAKARDLQVAAAENGPTIPTMEDIAPGRTGLGRLLSSDTARYVVGKVGGAVPSLAEGVGLAAAGGLVGSALGPEGTLAGAGEGVIEGFLGKGIVKSAISRLIKARGEEMVAANLIPEATEAALADAVRAGSKAALSNVVKEATAISARRGLAAANALNMAGLNTGALANEGASPETAVIGGAIGALPAMVVPELVGAKLYPGIAKAVGQRLGGQYVTRLATEALKDAGVLGTAMSLQEAANTISRNIEAGKDATNFSDADWTRIKEAAVGGALTGPVLAPLTARGTREAFAQQPKPPAAGPGPGTPAEVPPPPVPPTELGAVGEAMRTSQEEQAANLLAEQQAAIDQRLAPPPVPPAPPLGPSAEDLGRAMVGETPETAAERRARVAAYGLAGAPVPDATSEEQATAAAGRAMMGPPLGPAPAAEIFYHGSRSGQEPSTLLISPVKRDRADLRGQVAAAYLSTDEGIANAYAGSNGKVTTWVFKPDARVLREGSPEFESIASSDAVKQDLPEDGRIVTRAARIADAAKLQGYDGIIFRNQGQLGTLVFDSSAVERAQTPEKLLAAPVSSPTPEEAKLQQVKQAIETPGITYQYTVFRPGEGIPDAVQIDVISPDRSQSLASTNLAELRSLGVNLPEVPPDLPQNQYTVEEIRAATPSPKPAEPAILPAAQPAAAAPPAQEIPAANAGVGGTAPGVAGAPEVAPAKPEVQTLYRFNGRKSRQSVETPVPANMVTADQWAELAPLRGPKGEPTSAFRNAFERTLKGNKRLLAAQAANEGSREARTAAGGKSFRFGSRPDGATDIIDVIQELGGVPRPPKENRGGEFDAFEEVFRGNKKLLIGKRSGGFDAFTQDIASAFPQFAHVEGMGLSALGGVIDQALTERAALKARMGTESLEGAQAQRFSRAVIEGKGRKASKVGKPVSVDDLSVGAKLKAQGQELEVESVSPDDGSVKLKDGPRFGDQVVPAGTVVHPDRGTLRQPKGGDYFAGSGVPEGPDAVAPKAEAPAAPVAFEAGKVIEGEPSLDFRNTPNADMLTPEQWEQTVQGALDHADKLGYKMGSHDSSKADTRIGVALQAPDGRVILTGATIPDRTLDVAGKTAVKEVALQRMGVDEAGKRAIQASGNKPALLKDAVEAGFKPLAILHFDAEPGKIHQVFPDQQSFDRAWNITDKTQGRNIQPEQIPAKMFRNAHAEEQINREIEKLGDDYLRATEDERPAIKQRILDLYAKLRNLTRINQQRAADGGLPEERDPSEPEYRRSGPSGFAIKAVKHSTFQRVIANLQQLGARVDLVSREILAQNSAEEVQKRVSVVEQQLAQTTDPAAKSELNRQLGVLQERAQAAQQAAGVTYEPWHFAVAMRDIANASSGDMVTLLHEAAESLTMRLTIEQRGAVRTAIDTALDTLRTRATAAAEKTGVERATETAPHDLLAETLAQEFTAKGIPDAPNLAQAIVRWVKDLYYRAAMALQRGFGAEPDPTLALDWFENQLRREISGDYSYELGNLIGRYVKTPPIEQVRRFDGRRATPGGIADFLDPVTGVVRQPQVESLNRDALDWNLQYRTLGDPGKDLDIPDPEARARIKGGVLNSLRTFYEAAKAEIAPDMTWNDFFALVKRPGEEDPKLLLAALNEKFAASGEAEIGGDRMTDPMNHEAQVEFWSRLRKLGLSMRRKVAQSDVSIADATKEMSKQASTVNKLEADVRNAALHEDVLREKARGLVRELAQAVTRGRNTAHLQGALAESIRQMENLRDDDAIPQAYRDVLTRVYDGQTPVFDYIRAIAELDLPLAEMTTKEVMAAMKSGADLSPPLANLMDNKPLAVVLATLARRNAEQVDQIQLGWLRDTSRFRDIHGQLEEIKTATSAGLKQLEKQFNENRKATGLLGRLKASYFAKRRRQEALSDRIQRHEERKDLLNKALIPTDKAADEAAQAAGGAQYEWAPEENAVWTAMRQDDEGNWKRVTKVLHFNPDGSAIDGDQLRKDISTNMRWLRERADDLGKPRYNQIKSQTEGLKMLDAHGQQQRTWSNGILNGIDRFVRTPIATARSLGGPSMQRIVQMLHKYQFVLRSYSRSLDAPAFEWQHEFARAREASGLKDNGEFLNQVYKPAMYFLSVNPGLEENAAIRQVTSFVRAGLKTPGENFNEQFGNFLRKTKTAEGTLLGLAEKYGVFVEDKRLGPELRRAVAKGYLTGMRSLNGGLVDVLNKDMINAGWKLRYKTKVEDGKVVKTLVGPATFDALDPANAADPEERAALFENLGNTEALTGLLGRLFPPAVIGQWLEPFIEKPGQEPFSYRNEPIPQSLVQEAWGEAGGDVLKWIDTLGQKLDVKPDKKGNDPAALFRLSMLRNLDQLFGHEAKLAADSGQVPGLLDPHGAKPHALMDARVSDLLPPEHVEFATYEPENMHRLMARVAYHGAFGRNATHIQGAFREMMNHLKGRQSQFETLASLHTSKAGRVAEAVARGWNYDELATAAKRYQAARDFQDQLESVLGISANSGPLGDFHKGMSILNFITGQIVDNPKTAAYNLISPAMRPLAQRSLGPGTISSTARVYADILQTGLGSLFQSFGLHLFKAGKYADTIGNAEGRAFSNLPYGVILSDIGHSGDSQAGMNKWLIKPLKIVRQLQRKGVQAGGGEAEQFPRLSLIPGLGVINSISNIEVQAGGASLAREFETLIRNGVDYLSAHPDAANDPAFRFKESNLYSKWDKGLFDWWKQKATEYNLGNLEDIARAASERQIDDPAARLLTEEQALTLSMMNQNEFSGNSSINTTPGWLMTNRFLRMSMPLMRWPLWMMSAVHESAKPRAGENAVKPFLRTMGTLALWNLPLGIAFSFLMDEYDKKLVGRKSNLPELSGAATFPLLGVPLTLLQSKKPLTDIETMLVRSARAGNIYGLGGDVAAQMFAGLDPTTGQRSASLDQRVLVASQISNIMSAVNAWAHGGEATWGSVARPLFMAMGGNGALHAVDLANHLLDLDNAQSRLVQRAASSNWIRSAAQELDMDIKHGDAFASPTPLSTQTRQMYLAALANDRADFLDAYRKALDAAREIVLRDPDIRGADLEKEAINRVLSSWRSRAPMSVLASRPTDQQMRQMLSVMDPEGQQSVRDAISRYQAFTAIITPTPIERYFERQMAIQRSQYDPEAIRRRMTGGALLFSTH